MLIKMAVALGASVIICFVFAKPLLGLIILPLDRVTNGNAKPYLRTLEVMGGLTLSMRLAFYAGIVVACPLLLWFLGQFLLPALTRKERRMILPVFTAGVLLFLAGGALAYFLVIPTSLGFSIQYNDYLGISSEWTIDNYASFVSYLMLAFGLCFELPLVVLALAKLGLVSSKFLRSKRRIVIVLLFIVAGVITPTTEPFVQCLLALPMVLLFEACIWIAWWMEKRNRP
jgi:sec-independent protein translocase protein TatC